MSARNALFTLICLAVLVMIVTAVQLIVSRRFVYYEGEAPR